MDEKEFFQLFSYKNISLTTKNDNIAVLKQIKITTQMAIWLIQLYDYCIIPIFIIMRKHSETFAIMFMRIEPRAKNEQGFPLSFSFFQKTKSRRKIDERKHTHNIR